MDDLTKEQRHKNMSHIRSINSKPEEKVRKFLFSQGLRYRKNVRTLPGCPDIVLPKYKTVVFINGWHKHDCSRFKWPKTNQEYWIPKINKNVERDLKAYHDLKELGWRVFVVWECSLKKNTFDVAMMDLLQQIKQSVD